MEKIQLSVTLASTPKEIYETLMSSSSFSEMTGAPAEIGVTSGSLFKCFGGMIEGRTIEAESNKRIVQAWRVKPWDPGFYSIVKFELAASGTGTCLNLVHYGFPAGMEGHLKDGWETNYLAPLRKRFGVR